LGGDLCLKRRRRFPAQTAGELGAMKTAGSPAASSALFFLFSSVGTASALPARGREKFWWRLLYEEFTPLGVGY